MANTHDIGDIVRVFSTFKQNNVLIDPSTVAATVKAPDGTSITYTFAGSTVTRDGTGEYHVDIAPTMAGTYRYRFFSTGTGTGAEESWFQVRTRKVV